MPQVNWQPAPLHFHFRVLRNLSEDRFRFADDPAQPGFAHTVSLRDLLAAPLANHQVDENRRIPRGDPTGTYR